MNMFGGTGSVFSVHDRVRDTNVRSLRTRADWVVLGFGDFIVVCVCGMAACRRVADGIFSRRVGSAALLMLGDVGGVNFFVGVRLGDMTAWRLDPGAVDGLHGVAICSGEAGAGVIMFGDEEAIVFGFGFSVVTTAWSLGTVFHRVIIVLTASSFFHWAIILLTASAVCVLESNLRPHRMGEMRPPYESLVKVSRSDSSNLNFSWSRTTFLLCESLLMSKLPLCIESLSVLI